MPPQPSRAARPILPGRAIRRAFLGKPCGVTEDPVKAGEPNARELEPDRRRGCGPWARPARQSVKSWLSRFCHKQSMMTVDQRILECRLPETPAGRNRMSSDRQNQISNLYHAALARAPEERSALPAGGLERR